MQEENPCWIVNPGCGVEPKRCDPCPAFKAKVTCWQFNWQPIAHACTFDERSYWSEFFAKQCIHQRCPIYLNHKKEGEERIAAFKYLDK